MPASADETIDLTYYQPLLRATDVKRIERGVEIAVDTEFLRIEALRDDVVRLKISRGGQFDEEPTFAVCAKFDAVPDFKVEEQGGTLRLSTPLVQVVVEKEPFNLNAHRSDGSALFESVVEKGTSWAYATINDDWVVRRKCRVDDAFYGLGEKTGRFNRRGRNFTLWNTDVLNPNAAGEFTATRDTSDPRSNARSTEFDPYYISVPFFYQLPQGNKANNPHAAMAGFFIDNGYRGHFEFTYEDEFRFHFAGGQYTEYLFGDTQMSEILEAYTWVTGRMEPPPLWALGYHQCRWYPYVQETVEKLGQTYREKEIPCDVLWLDIHYMNGYRVFTWNGETFPDPSALLEKLRANGYRVITIIDPGVKVEPGYEIYDQAVERDVLCKTEGGAIYIGQVWPGKTAFPDFVTEEARRWWGELNAAHVHSGLAGIWNDMNEPATGDIPATTMRFGNGKYSHERYHNQYGLLMAMGTRDGLLEAMPNERTFILSRAAFAGMQRYAAVWMGDNLSRWDHLWMSLPMGLGLGVSGQPFVGADIGGFAEGCHGELLARWTQCGALTPFARNHNSMGNPDQYPWAFGAAIEELCRESIKLRYRLLPYLYAAFMKSAESGEPVQKPLMFHYQDDATAREIDDQYLLGESLLVAPIYTPGTWARNVYLPAGTWYNWHTGERVSGERFLTVQAPMENIPVFARGGSVIPMWTEAPASTMNYHPETIELHVFVPDEDGEYTSLLHEDDGHSFAFREGAYNRTQFVLTRSGKNLTLRAETSGNGYAEFTRKEFRVVVHDKVEEAVVVDGKNQQWEENILTLQNAGTPFSLEFKVR